MNNLITNDPDFVSIIQALLNAKPINVDKIADGDPLYQKSKLMEGEFTDLVDVMKQNKYFPLPAINSLMTLFYNLVGNKITPVAMHPAVKMVGFLCHDRFVKGKRILQALICVPEDWHERLISDAHMQMGALVYVASQSKDYWNNKFASISPTETKETQDRAYSYEVELLNHFKQSSPNFKPNEYQQKIMKHFPNGVKSVSSHYEGRSYDGVFPPYPVDTNNFTF